MRVGEWGVVFLFSTGFNMQNSTLLSLKFTKPDGTALTVTNLTGVTVGTSPITTTLGVFAANQYVQYTFKNGDVNQAGTWVAQLTYQDATPQNLISDPSSFTVNA